MKTFTRNAVRSVLQTPRRLLLLAIFLIGIAHVCFLPPFEGFDETAHWSSITFIAYEGRIPVYGQDAVDRAVRDYPGPFPYTSLPPFEDVKGVNYRDFDASAPIGPKDVAPPSNFSPTTENNWQAQHPPLYYIILTPLRMLFAGADWVQMFLVLRLASWVMAFAGFAIAVEATYKKFGAVLGGGMALAAWPFFFPQFFPEMARLGNDSLCLLAMGVAWTFLLRMDEGGRRRAVALGAALGVGLWTKAFFLPITAGVVAYLLWQSWRSGDFQSDIVKGLSAPFITGATAAVIGGGWYVYKFLSVGDFTGGDEFVQLNQDGAFITRLISNFALYDFSYGIASIIASFTWTGTWSLARPMRILTLGPILILALTLLRWAIDWRRLPTQAQAPLFIAAPMVAGLVFHLLSRIAAGQIGGTPGWYLHILAPAVSLAVAWGYCHSRIAPWLAAYCAAFAAYAWTLQISMFSGCAGKFGAQKTYSFEGATCFIDGAQLSALGYPVAGVIFLIGGVAIAGRAVYKAMQTS